MRRNHSFLRPPSSRITCAIIAVAAIWFLVPAQAIAATSVSQFGITWTFASDRPAGRFANGDWWVVGPVTITAISPASVVSSGATMHGSMINPAVNAGHGYDSRIRNNTFLAATNVGLALPLTVPAGSSLVSAESYVTAVTGDNPQLKTAAILTVLASAAPAGSFRPPYIGSDKTIRWNKNQMDYSKLGSLPLVAGASTPAAIATQFERPWIEQRTNWTGRYMHPGLNQPTYGREMAYALGTGLLTLQLNYSHADKETLLIRLVQYGIDVYGAAVGGAAWGNDGGHNHGRKMPLLLAATVLDDADIRAYADGTNRRIFQEDQQTWYVQQSDVGRVLYTADGRQRDQYLQSDVGMAEWGEKHTGSPQRDGRNWNVHYRANVGSSILGHVLVARLMGLESSWNWPALFDYCDRYWSIEQGNPTGAANQIPRLTHAMWTAYRNTPAGNTAPTIAAIPAQTTAMGVAKTVSVSIGDAQTSVSSLHVTATSSNQTLVPNSNLVCTGTTATRTLTVTPAAGQSGTATITVTVSDGALSTSSSFALTVSAGASTPTITAQPQHAAVSVGQTATFTVTATGAAALTYQWQRNGTTIGGAIAASYTTPATTLGDDGATFRVVVTNGAVSVTSASATLEVNEGAGAGGGDEMTESGQSAAAGGCGVGAGLASLLLALTCCGHRLIPTCRE